MVGQCPGVTDDGDETSDLGDGALISLCRDGPLLVRGDFQIVDEAGVEIDPGRRTIALCRCGRSGRRPFCDGSHRAVNFRASGGDERRAAPVAVVAGLGKPSVDEQPLAG